MNQYKFWLTIENGEGQKVETKGYLNEPFWQEHLPKIAERMIDTLKEFKPI